MQRCNQCHVEKDFSEFAKDRTKKTGRSRRCKECQNELSRSHYKRNKTSYKDSHRKRKQMVRDFIFDVKSKNPCCLCGETNPICIDFHHIFTKSFVISQAVQRNVSLKTAQEELSKCACLCANCHRILHYYQRHDDLQYQELASRLYPCSF